MGAGLGIWSKMLLNALQPQDAMAGQMPTKEQQAADLAREDAYNARLAASGKQPVAQATPTPTASPLAGMAAQIDAMDPNARAQIVKSFK